MIKVFSTPLSPRAS